MKGRWLTVPNALTLLRLLSVPVFAWLFVSPHPGGRLWAAAVFGLASLTDMVDGMVARRWGQVTEFGVWFDQFVDKVLVWTALGLFVVRQDVGVGWWSPAVIFVRDVGMLAMREAVKRRTGRTMRTGWWGKAKSAVQMVSVVAIVGLLGAAEAGWAGAAAVIRTGIPARLVDLGAVLAVISWAVYLRDYAGIRREGCKG